MTLQVAAGISKALQEGGFRHVIFKSIRPFPFTPNDTDILMLEPSSRYSEATDYLLDYGAGARWVDEWVSPVSAPVAARLRLLHTGGRADTLLLHIGSRG